jgi:hypothetical protein
MEETTIATTPAAVAGAGADSAPLPLSPIRPGLALVRPKSALSWKSLRLLPSQYKEPDFLHFSRRRVDDKALDPANSPHENRYFSSARSLRPMTAAHLRRVGTKRVLCVAARASACLFGCACGCRCVFGWTRMSVCVCVCVCARARIFWMWGHALHRRPPPKAPPAGTRMSPYESQLLQSMARS